jgi:RIO kinase 1
MHDPLAPLLADGVIDEVVARLKSGKEADLWLVRHGAETVAAKVYKARDTRSFKNDVAYREGRQVRNSRTQRAMDRGSRFGRAASEEDWKVREADALHALHAAGVRVPRPVLYYEGVLLMELVVDTEGQPAPRLVDAPLDAARAADVYADLRGQAVRMLCTDRIHGDLSPYNVLLGRDGPVVIDFPQVIGAAHNSQAERFFVRDLENLRLHLESIAPVLRARAGDARQIWRAYTRRELTPEFVPQERPPDEVGERRPDRSRRDRPRGDQPQGGRPRSDRPQGDRPRNDRPQGDRPRSDRPRGDRSRNDRPQGDRPPQAPPRQPAPHGQGPSRSARPDPGRPDPRERRQHGDRGQRRDARGQGQGPERQRDDRRGDRPPRREGPQPEVVRVQRLAPAPARLPQPPGVGRPPQPAGPSHPHRGHGGAPGQRGPRDPRDPDGRHRR